MGHSHHHRLEPGQRPFPLPPLIGAAILVFVSIAAVAGYRIFATPEASPDAGAPVLVRRHLRFDDSPDGSVIVRDSNDGTLVQVLQPGEYGFVRATLRGLVRTRKALGETDNMLPFLIELRASGRLMLIDPLTDQEVDLWAFGASNAEQFAGLLDQNTMQAPETREISALGENNRTHPISESELKHSN